MPLQREVEYGVTQEVEFAVAIAVTEHERFGLAAVGDANFDRLGSLLAPIGDRAAWNGVGTMTPGPATKAGFTPCTRLPATHGFRFEGQVFWLDLPAGSVSVLTVPAKVSPEAYWPGDFYSLAFAFVNSYQDEPGTLDPQHSAITSSIRAAGPHGTRLAITTTPSHGSVCQDPPDDPGTPITISGRSDPSLPGEPVAIMAAHEGGAPYEVATVQASGDGRFRLEGWTPPRLGRWELQAVYRGGADRAPDFSAPIAVDFTAPVPPADPLARLAGPLIGSDVVVRGRSAVVRLSCPARCRGVATLRVGRRVVARAKFDRPRGDGRLVRLRLPAALARRIVAGETIRAQVELAYGRRRHAQAPVSLRRAPYAATSSSGRLVASRGRP